MKNKLIIPLLLVFTSCMATQNDMLVLQSQIDDLNSNIYTLKKNQADLSLKIDDLNKNLTAFSENTLGLSTEMSKLSSKIDDYGNLTDKKINQIGKAVSQKNDKDDSYSKEADLFYKSLSLYSSKKYEQSIESFKEYILTYPKGQNIDWAYYYTAESLFEIKNYKESAIFYAKIISNFPAFEKTAYVRIKYSLSLIRLKDKTKNDEALTYLKSVERDFHGSFEAQTAKQLIEEYFPKNITKNPKTQTVKKQK
ncbi:MAG: tetratricopeptide repeat protein [Elusimicrobiales bacterium]|jgi:TolA-binding protein|nr:tetratricopeptide repeat protein [Elusimicrobiales bacterium]NLH39234.1 tetratricopeptide repeat protein [Elusimicrobiota bacterium]